jgi:hypothetical protein
MAHVTRRKCVGWIKLAEDKVPWMNLVKLSPNLQLLKKGQIREVN